MSVLKLRLFGLKMKSTGILNNLNYKIMKYFNLSLFVILSINFGFSQESPTAVGGDFSGSGGNVAFSIGQVFYITTNSTTNSSAQGVQQTYQISTNDIQEAIISNLCSVFPNPTADFLILQLGLYENSLRFELSDENGKIICNELIKNSKTEINMISQPKATYFLRVLKGSKQIQTFKIIKN